MDGIRPGALGTRPSVAASLRAGIAVGPSPVSTKCSEFLGWGVASSGASAVLRTHTRRPRSASSSSRHLRELNVNWSP